MDGIIIYKLSQWQIRGPIVLLIADVATQILLQYLIGLLGLIISLRMKSKRKLNIDLQDLKEESLQNLDINCGSRSDMISCGNL